MSRTYRRTHFNKQSRRVFRLYWMIFSEQEVLSKDYISPQKYHSDNYYSKHVRGCKSTFVNLRNRELRQEANQELKKVVKGIQEDVVLRKKPASIKWDIT